MTAPPPTMPTTPGLTDAEKTRRLPWLFASEAAGAVFCTVTVFGATFVLFLDELGLNKSQIGFIMSLLPFAGLVALFAAPWVARIGLKRAVIIFLTSRKLVVVLLVLTPWVLSRFGAGGAFHYVASVLVVFAVLRATAETALLPWIQEFVPNRIRGKVMGVGSIVGNLASVLAVIPALYVVDHFHGLRRFSWVFAGGAAIGIISVMCLLKIPGGAPVPHRVSQRAHFGAMLRVLRDANFLFFLAGVGLLTFAVASSAPFVPLFLKDQAGLSPGTIIGLRIPGTIGSLLLGYWWGWRADRRGGKSAVLLSLSFTACVPICWWLIPRDSPLSAPVAMGLAFLAAAAAAGMGVGYMRLLYVSVAPPEEKMQYMALFYAWTGLVGGLAPLATGIIVDSCEGISGRFLIFHLDQYVPMFFLSAVFYVVAIVAFRRLRSDRPAPGQD